MARKMKNSGLQWIEDIPIEWEVKRLKYAALEFGKGSGITKEDVFEDGDVPCVRYGEIYSRYDNTFTECYSKTKKRINKSPHYFGKGDILFAGTGELVEEIGKNIVYMGDIPCMAGGDIIIMKHNQNPVFLNYALISNYAQAQKSKGKAKLKVVHISPTDIKNILLILPPRQEQDSIALFLDNKCNEIDRLVGDLEAEVKILTDYKKSIIAEAVFHGLDSLVSQKKTELGWIDNIPEHWEIARIASVYTVRSVKVSDKVYKPLSVTMKGIVPQLESAAKTKNGDERKLIRKGDFVINSRSDRRGSCGISDYDGSCSLINTVLAPREEMNPRYYNWLFHTTQFADEFYKWGYGIADDLWTTNWGAMRRIQIPMPPIDEQIAIANYLDVKCKEIEETIVEKRQQIEKIKDYKASLIYEYVTGKKQVV